MWFWCKGSYNNAAGKKEKVEILIDSVSFTEAEKKFGSYLADFNAENEIEDITKKKIRELFLCGDGEKYYLVKMEIVTLDEKKGVEKKTSAYVIVEASDIKDAIARFETGMKGSMMDYAIASVAETKLIDVDHNLDEKEKK